MRFARHATILATVAVAVAGATAAQSWDAAAQPAGHHAARSSVAVLPAGLRRTAHVRLSSLPRQRAVAQPNGFAPAPGETYFAQDPDHNSQFSPGGAHKGSGTLAGASGNQTTTPSAASGTVGFTGITGPQQAAVNDDGDLEPPDQGLCTDGTSVLEFVNNAVAVYSPSGQTVVGPVAATAVLGLPSTDFLADPRCYFDAPTHRWFLYEFNTGSTNQFGVATAPSTQYVAVSDTADPTGGYHVYSFDTTDSTISGCPCFGDFDQVGADANGIYVSTNEFGLASGAFNGSLIYAIGKSSLEHASLGGSVPPIVTYRLISDDFGQPYHVAPASSPDSAYAPNREYFVESNSNANHDNRLIVYTLSGTHRLLNGGTPTLSSTTITSEAYAFPPNASIKAGTIPLGDSVGEPKGSLQADFNAIQEVTYADDRLFAELSTASADHTAGVAWFVLRPTADGPVSTARVSSQGYVTAPSGSLLYPSIGVDATGHGAMAFSLSGGGYYPSAAAVAFGPRGPGRTIHVVAPGAAPEDGFTCYAAFVGPDYGGCRWGDYSMAVTAGSRVYMATEYIGAAPRDYYTNWSTYVWSSPIS